jgi:hypothetical protein
VRPFFPRGMNARAMLKVGELFGHFQRDALALNRRLLRQSAFDHDRGAEAVAIEYLHVRIESQPWPWWH